MNRAFKLSAAYLLLAVFAWTTVPVHLVHELTAHHDTMESRDDALVVSIQHIHCESLQLSLPAFSEAAVLRIGDHVATKPFTLVLPLVSAVSVYHSLSPSGRAPPVLV